MKKKDKLNRGLEVILSEPFSYIHCGDNATRLSSNSIMVIRSKINYLLSILGRKDEWKYNNFIREETTLFGYKAKIKEV